MSSHCTSTYHRCRLSLIAAVMLICQMLKEVRRDLQEHSEHWRENRILFFLISWGTLLQPFLLVLFLHQSNFHHYHLLHPILLFLLHLHYHFNTNFLKRSFGRDTLHFRNHSTFHPLISPVYYCYCYSYILELHLNHREHQE